MTNNLRKERTARAWTQPGVSEMLKRIDPRIDVSMVSRYEQGVCLPTKEQLEELEKIMSLDRRELYDPEDLDLLGMLPHMGHTEDTEKVVRMEPPSHIGRIRKCYRMSPEFASSLPDDLLQVCGYSSWQSWHDAALKRLLGEYAARKKGLARQKKGA